MTMACAAHTHAHTHSHCVPHTHPIPHIHTHPHTNTSTHMRTHRQTQRHTHTDIQTQGVQSNCCLLASQRESLTCNRQANSPQRSECVICGYDNASQADGEETCLSGKLLPSSGTVCIIFTVSHPVTSDLHGRRTRNTGAGLHDAWSELKRGKWSHD